MGSKVSWQRTLKHKNNMTYVLFNFFIKNILDALWETKSWKIPVSSNFQQPLLRGKNLR